MVTVSETLIREILDRLIRLETLMEANQRETNQRFDDVKAHVDVPFENLQRELRAGFKRLRYLVLGGGAVIIATVLATHFLG